MLTSNALLPLISTKIQIHTNGILSIMQHILQCQRYVAYVT